MSEDNALCQVTRRPREQPFEVSSTGSSMDGMVLIPGGTFRMGSDDHYLEEASAHKVTVGPFWMKRHTVTNAEFARFVEATAYVTVAERRANPADYPGATADKLLPSS